VTLRLKPLYLKIGLAIGIFVLVAYLGIIVFGDNGLLDLNRKKERLRAIQAKNRTVEKESVDLYRRVTRLKNDPLYLEYVIRQELCVVGEDEIVFKFNSRD